MPDNLKIDKIKQNDIIKIQKIQKKQLKDLENLLQKQKDLLSYQEKIISETINNQSSIILENQQQPYSIKKLKSILKKPKVKFSKKIDYQNYNDYYKKKIDFDNNNDNSTRHNENHKKKYKYENSSSSSSLSSSSSSLDYPKFDDEYKNIFDSYKKNSFQKENVEKKEKEEEDENDENEDESTSISSNSTDYPSSPTLEQNIILPKQNKQEKQDKKNKKDKKNKLYKVWLTKNVDNKHSNNQEYLKKFGVVEILNKKSPSAAAKNAVIVFEQRKNINLNKPISIMIIVYNTKLNRGIAYKIWRTTTNLPNNILPTHVLKTQKIFQINNINFEECLNWKWDPSYIKQPLKNRIIDYKKNKINN